MYTKCSRCGKSKTNITIQPATEPSLSHPPLFPNSQVLHMIHILHGLHIKPELHVTLTTLHLQCSYRKWVVWTVDHPSFQVQYCYTFALVINSQILNYSNSEKHNQIEAF